MKRLWILLAIALLCNLCLVGCDGNTETPEVTTDNPVTSDEETTPEQTTTPEETTPEQTTPEETTEKEVVVHPTRDQIKVPLTASSFMPLGIPSVLAAANNEQQDWSDFGGLTVNEDGTFTALFRMGTNDIWDPYFYLIKEDTVVDNILVIQYRSEIDQTLNMYAGTEGNAATGAGDHITDEMYATTGDEWGYLILNLAETASCYDASASSLGYMRFGLSMAESGDTIQFGFVAFFNSMDQVNEYIPY